MLLLLHGEAAAAAAKSVRFLRGPLHKRFLIRFSVRFPVRCHAKWIEIRFSVRHEKRASTRTHPILHPILCPIPCYPVAHAGGKCFPKFDASRKIKFVKNFGDRGRLVTDGKSDGDPICMRIGRRIGCGIVRVDGP
jgi:hypothetical protein